MVSRCGNAGHFASEYNLPPQRWIHYVNPKEEVYYTILEEEVYYTIPEEDNEEVVAHVFQVHPTYGRGKAPQQPLRTNMALQPVLTGPSHGMMGQIRYQNCP